MTRALACGLLAAAVLAATAGAATPKAANPLGLKIATALTNAGPFGASIKVKSGTTVDLDVTTKSPLPAGDTLEVEWQGTGSMGGWHAFATCAAAPCDELAKQTEVGVVRFRAVVKKSPYSLPAKALSTSVVTTVSWTR